MGYRWEQPAYVLSYANRRRLEIARALATQPRLLLLDEPAAGMNPNETHEVTEVIGRLRDELGLDDPRDRARHARRRGDLRPRGRARPWRQDHRGQRSSRSRPTRPWSRPTWAATRRRWPRPDVLLGSTTSRPTTGQMRILEGVQLEVDAGELVCLLGGNASGKSTTLKTILGLVRPRPDASLLEGEDIDPLAGGAADRQRPRDRPREPAAVRADDRAREPRARRGAPGRVDVRRGPRARPRAVPAPARSARTSSRARCPAASSRWSRWGVR